MFRVKLPTSFQMEETLYNSILQYKTLGSYNEGINKQEKHSIRQKSKHYIVIMNKLHKVPVYTCITYLWNTLQYLYDLGEERKGI